MTRNSYPFDKLFAEHDTSQIGGLTFEDFVSLNETVEVSMNKQDLKRVFGIIDKNNSGVVTMDEVRNISAMTMAPEEDNLFEEEGLDMPDEDLKGDEILVRQQVNDIYNEVKNKLEEKGIALE
jgi:Ca2+-binding EF-hand superfamily protein